MNCFKSFVNNFIEKIKKNNIDEILYHVDGSKAFLNVELRDILGPISFQEIKRIEKVGLIERTRQDQWEIKFRVNKDMMNVL